MTPSFILKETISWLNVYDEMAQVVNNMYNNDPDIAFAIDGDGLQELIGRIATYFESHPEASKEVAETFEGYSLVG